jgi:hypothetical protein
VWTTYYRNPQVDTNHAAGSTRPASTGMCTSRPAHRPRDDHRARLGYSLDQAGDPYQSEQVMHRPYVDLFVSAEQSGIQAVFRGKRTYVASPRRVDPTSIRVDLAEACPVRPATPFPGTGNPGENGPHRRRLSGSGGG